MVVRKVVRLLVKTLQNPLLVAIVVPLVHPDAVMLALILVRIHPNRHLVWTVAMDVPIHVVEVVRIVVFRVASRDVPMLVVRNARGITVMGAAPDAIRLVRAIAAGDVPQVV